MQSYNGQLIQAVFLPADSTEGLYDVQLFDAEGVDLLHGKGSHKTTTKFECVQFAVGLVAYGKLTLGVSNVAFKRRGRLVVYLR